MRQADFQAGFPGALTPTSFHERTASGDGRSVRGMAFSPHPLPPLLDSAAIGRLFDVLDRCRSGLLRLEGLIEALPGRTVLLAAMRTREAQASSKIENTIASMKDIMLARVAPSRAPGEAMEVVRNRVAIEHGLNSALPISNRLLREMHARLIVDPRMRPGQFRDIQVCIGDEHRGFEHCRFVPPPPEDVERHMREWELFVHPDALEAPTRARLPYFVELALCHYQFETIHPFSDGNGRLGRALVTLAPVKDGELRHPVCNLSEWVHDHRDEYYDRLLRVSTHGEWEEWVRFFCTALEQQAAADTKRAERVGALYRKYVEVFTTPRSSMLVTKLLDRLFEFQGITVQSAADVMGISYTAAQRHVKALVAKRILTPVDKEEYGKVFIARGIIRAIQGQAED